MPPTRPDRAATTAVDHAATAVDGGAGDTDAAAEVTESTAATRADQALADIAALSYEKARDELTAIVARLEGGQAPLEESMALWRRGEALAAHCTAWLDAAQAEVSAPDAAR